MTTEHFDAVVVGSGFGGSVMSYRLQEAGLNVCVLERGKPFPPGSFPRTPNGMHENFWDPSEGLFGMFNVWSFRHLGALVSSGLGGGSLIYANVLLRKDEKWFVREEAGRNGYEYWPINRAQLDPHYDRVERMMDSQRFPFAHAPYDATQKTRGMRVAAAELGLKWMLPPLAVTFGNAGAHPVPGEPIVETHRNLHDRTRYTCLLCGECDIGCNHGSKNTLDYNYLSEAKRLGAELRTLCEVVSFEPRADGGYFVRYRRHTLGEPTPRDARLLEVTTDRLILAAGTLGSTYLLQKNRASFPGLSDALGKRFCGNGDLLAFAIRGHEKVDGVRRPWALDATRGPVITSAIRMPDASDDGGEGRGFYIEDAGFPAFVSWLLETAGALGTMQRFKRVLWRRLQSLMKPGGGADIGGDISYLLGAAELSSTSVPLLGMGRDMPDGTLHLREGRLQSDWRIDGSTAYFTRLRDTMRRIADVWDAGFRDNALWHLNRRVITVHPLGGCSMGRDSTEGVVNEFGEVFGYPGFYVADGAAMPGPVGANPALTIAAFADRGADSLIAGVSGAERRISVPGIVGDRERETA